MKNLPRTSTSNVYDQFLIKAKRRDLENTIKENKLLRKKLLERDAKIEELNQCLNQKNHELQKALEFIQQTCGDSLDLKCSKENKLNNNKNEATVDNSSTKVKNSTTRHSSGHKNSRKVVKSSKQVKLAKRNREIIELEYKRKCRLAELAAQCEIEENVHIRAKRLAAREAIQLAKDHERAAIIIQKNIKRKIEWDSKKQMEKENECENKSSAKNFRQDINPITNQEVEDESNYENITGCCSPEEDSSAIMMNSTHEDNESIFGSKGTLSLSDNNSLSDFNLPETNDNALNDNTDSDKLLQPSIKSSDSFKDLNISEDDVNNSDDDIFAITDCDSPIENILESDKNNDDENELKKLLVIDQIDSSADDENFLSDLENSKEMDDSCRENSKFRKSSSQADEIEMKAEDINRQPRQSLENNTRDEDEIIIDSQENSSSQKVDEDQSSTTELRIDEHVDPQQANQSPEKYPGDEDELKLISQEGSCSQKVDEDQFNTTNFRTGEHGEMDNIKIPNGDPDFEGNFSVQSQDSTTAMDLFDTDNRD